MQYITLTGVFFCLSIALAGCDKKTEPTAQNPTNTSTEANQTPQSIQNNANPSKQNYAMAVDANYPPFAYKDDKGHAIGFDIDIIKAIAEKENFQVSFVPQPWNTIFAGLNQDKYAIVGSGVGNNADRRKEFNMSNPYVFSGLMITKSADNTALNSIADIKNKKIGIVKGTTWIKDLEKHVASPNDIVEYPTTFLAFKALSNGQVDGVFEDKLVSQYFVKTLTLETGKKFSSFDYDLLNTSGELAEDEGLSFAMKKGNSELTTKINNGLDKIKADGTYDKIYQNWFGTLPSK